MSSLPDSDFPKPPPIRENAHKGDHGRLLLIGGSARMMGAAVLAARAALRSGIGLLEVALPESRQPQFFAAVPEALTIPLPERDGAIARSAVDIVLGIAEGFDAVALGPGMSRAGEVESFARDFVTALERPIVLDADGLNAFETRASLLAARTAETILTPHPGEAARLLDVASPRVVQDDREDAARQIALLTRSIVLLKGAATLVDDGARVHVNTTGNPGLATGGSGDVLTGILGALLAAGMDPFDAARLGVWVHGRAADRCVSRASQRGLIPSDVVDELPMIWREVDGA